MRIVRLSISISTGGGDMANNVSVAMTEECGSKAPAQQKLPKKRIFTANNLICWFIVAIPLIGFLVFNGFTIGVSFVSMFCDMEYNQLNTLTWNNYANFVEAFTNPKVLKSIGVTLIIASAQFVSLAIAIIIAGFLSQNIKGKRIFQTLYFVPYICSSVAVAIMWKVIFGHHGALNAIVGGETDWLNNLENPSTLTWAIWTTIVWPSPGYGIVMYCAAFSAINPALYEAADLDGANAFQKFWNITLPGISNITFFLVLAGISAGLTCFDQANVLAPATDGNAGPDNAGLTFMYHIYIEGVQFGHMGYASVLSWAMFVVMMIPAGVMIKKRVIELEDK